MVAQGEGWGEGIVSELGMDMCTLLYLKWIINKDLLYSTWDSAKCYVEAWMGGEFGAEWIRACVWLTPSLLTPNYHSMVNRLYPNIK